MTRVTGISAPRAASSSAPGRLVEGASGAAVKELQQLLKAVGLYGKNADGKFGPVTGAAVKAFQRRYGLTADGWAGPQTMAKLRQVAAPKPAAPTPAAPGPSSSGGKLVLGASGPEVKELQLRLKAQGYYNGNIGGNFGPGTEAAVKAFQRANRLTIDGWVGPQTMAKLRGASGPTPTTPTTPITPITPTAPTSPNARVQAAIDFGMTQLGAPYVGGGSPFRFGRPGNGQIYQMQGQRPYRSPAGVVGYDCSGFIVTLFRKAGVDLGGMSSSAAMKASLPPVPKNQLQPGDLLVKNGHVVMYIGDGKVLESASSGDPDGDGLGNGSVRVTDAGKYLNDSSYVGRHVPLT